jgi:predicted RNA polymerase sigma factor
MLDHLPPQYRAAVVLRYWYELSYREIAEVMGTTESAVKSRLYRAREMLAQRAMASQTAETAHNAKREREAIFLAEGARANSPSSQSAP